MPAEGIAYTIVNGDVLYEHGIHSGYLPGRVLRSGVNQAISLVRSRVA
jgi:hypothetical protein